MIRQRRIIILLIISIFILIFSLKYCERQLDIVPEQQQDFCSLIHRTDSSTLDSELKKFDSLAFCKTGIYVLEDGGGSLITRAWLCDHATKSIDVQYFIYSTDNVGLIASDYLVRAADRGVKVRIIVDDITIETGIHEILTLNSHPNIEIKIYNPGVNLGKNIFQRIGKFTLDFRNSNQRMHNKILLVDNKVAITGGRNIADEYFDYDHEYNFRDRDVLMLGRVCKEVKNSFESFWNSNLSVVVTRLIREDNNDFTNPKRFERLHQYACNPENFWPQIRNEIKNFPKTLEQIENSGRFIWLDTVCFISDLPGKNKGKQGLNGGGVTTQKLVELVSQAKTSIDIQSPYLILPDNGIKLFKESVSKGIRIRILTNSLASTDNLEAFSGYQRIRKKLLEAGVEIYEFRPDAAVRKKMATGAIQKKLNYTPIFGLHAKTMVIDGKISVVGTFNLDPRSANLNTECFALIYSEQIASGILKGMNEEFKSENAWKTTANFNPDSQVNTSKRVKTFSKRVFPKSIL